MLAGGGGRHLDLAGRSTPAQGHTEFVRELGATLAEVLAYWVLRIEQDRAVGHRLAPGTNHPMPRTAPMPRT